MNASGLADWTALHLAAQRGHEKIVEQLIAKGAEINALTEEGFGGHRSMSPMQIWRNCSGNSGERPPMR